MHAIRVQTRRAAYWVHQLIVVDQGPMCIVAPDIPTSLNTVRSAKRSRALRSRTAGDEVAGSLVSALSGGLHGVGRGTDMPV